MYSDRRPKGVIRDSVAVIQIMGPGSDGATDVSLCSISMTPHALLHMAQLCMELHRELELAPRAEIKAFKAREAG
ncbi:MAG: hypothetical protein AAFX02_08505 [Pseudomonadota bacterium]